MSQQICSIGLLAFSHPGSKDIACFVYAVQNAHLARQQPKACYAARKGSGGSLGLLGSGGSDLTNEGKGLFAWGLGDALPQCYRGLSSCGDEARKALLEGISFRWRQHTLIR